MNKVILMGRLVRDPEVRYSQGAEPLAVARYTLAVNRRFKRQGEQDADFIGCVAFGKAGEVCGKIHSKKRSDGQALSVGCRYAAGMITRAKKRWSTDVVVEEQYFAESKASFENHKDAAPAATAPAPKQTALPMASIPLMKASKMMISPSKNLKKEDLES